jgi:hypothetical protein
MIALNSSRAEGGIRVSVWPGTGGRTTGVSSWILYFCIKALKTVFKKFKLQVEDAIPVDLFTGSSSEKLALFYEKRLPQLQLRLNTRRAPAPEPARSSAPSKKKNGGYTPPL